MTTLESASKRLDTALEALESRLARRGPGRAESAELSSLRQRYDDLGREYEALLARYESLLANNLTLSDRLDGTITRLKGIADIRPDLS
jgi:hypothetical protein